MFYHKYHKLSTSTMPRSYGILRVSVFASLLAYAVSDAPPDVAVQPLEVSCTSYPNYDESTGTAGPWAPVVADSTGAEVEGFGFQPVFAFAAGGGSWGFVRHPPRYLSSPLGRKRDVLSSKLPHGLVKRSPGVSDRS